MPSTPFAEEHVTLRVSVARLVAERLGALAPRAEAGVSVQPEAVAAIGDLGALDDVLADVVVAEELGRIRSGGLVAVLLDNLLVADLGEAPGDVVAVARRGEVAVRDGRADGRLPLLVGGAVARRCLVLDAGILVTADSGWQAAPVTRPHALRGAGLADVTLDGAPSRPVAIADAVLARAQLRTAAALTAAGWVTFDDALQYATQRTAFGRPIGKFQVNRHALAHASTWLTAAEALVHDTAWALAHDGPADTVAAYLAAARALGRTTDLAVQLHGGNGYTTAFDVARAWRDARAWALDDASRRAAVRRATEEVA